MKKLILLLGLVFFGSSTINDVDDRIRSMSDEDYFMMAINSASITLEAEEIINYSDSTVRFSVVASAFDTLGFHFPARPVTSKRFKFVTVQEDIDSLKNNTVFNTLMEKSRSGHNFWFNN